MDENPERWRYTNLYHILYYSLKESHSCEQCGQCSWKGFCQETKCDLDVNKVLVYQCAKIAPNDIKLNN